MADNELAVMSAVESSNIPASKKSFIRRYYESAMSHGGRGMERAKRTLIGGAQVLRQGGESAVVGAGLGALDVELPTGLDAHVGGVSIPIDALASAARFFWRMRRSVMTCVTRALRRSPFFPFGRLGSISGTAPLLRA